MAQTNSFVTLTGSGTIISGRGILSSMYVNSTSSLAFIIVNGLAGSATATYGVGGTITPAVGYHNLGNIDLTSAGYLNVSAGTGNVTFHIKKTD